MNFHKLQIKSIPTMSAVKQKSHSFQTNRYSMKSIFFYELSQRFHNLAKHFTWLSNNSIIRIVRFRFRFIQYDKKYKSLCNISLRLFQWYLYAISVLRLVNETLVSLGFKCKIFGVISGCVNHLDTEAVNIILIAPSQMSQNIILIVALLEGSSIWYSSVAPNVLGLIHGDQRNKRKGSFL